VECLLSRTRMGTRQLLGQAVQTFCCDHAVYITRCTQAGHAQHACINAPPTWRCAWICMGLPCPSALLHECFAVCTLILLRSIVCLLLPMEADLCWARDDNNSQV
jgi:hypothetical protein